VLKSDWYKQRLVLKQQKDIRFYDSQLAYLEAFIANPNNDILIEEMNIKERLKSVKKSYDHVKSPKYLKELVGTIGADPLYRK
jgi:hypothetical protein